MKTDIAQRIVIFIVAVSGTALGANGYSTDVDALLEIRDALDGPNSTFASWLPATNPCGGSWYGVACIGGRVTSLNLVNQTLEGELSPSIAALSELQVLLLTYNRLGGLLPDVFGNMTNLRYLDISRNRFVGLIPASFGNATNVTSLSFAFNNFNGSIPSTLANLRRLQFLNLSSNDLHGGIPPGLVQLPSIQTMDLSINALSGPLPVVPLSPTLTTMNVEKNQLLGTIPHAYLTGDLTFGYADNANLRLPIDPAPAPAPKPATRNATSATVNATSAATNATSALTNATSPAPAPRATAVSTPLAVPTSTNTTNAALAPQSSAQNATNGSVTPGSGSSNLVNPGSSPAPVGGSVAAGKDSGGSNTGVIVGVSVGIAVAACLAVAALLAFLAARKRRRGSAAAYSPAVAKDTWQSLPDPQPVSRPYGEARVYPLAMLIRGTHGFADSQQVGTSPGNKVYVATLPDGAAALIKRLDPAIAGFQSKSEFEKEVAELGRLNHRNLIPLAGCCDDDKERILVFSAPSATPLRDFLRSGGVSSPGKPPPRPLDFATRVGIASGTAAALAHLHSKSSPRLYEELASTSVLLDGNLTPRLADFHLEGNNDPASSSSPLAANPPQSPEGRQRQIWPARGGAKSVHADVYNLGLILLELIAGRPVFVASEPVDRRNLLTWANPLLSARDFDAFADPNLAGGCAAAALAALCDLARDCLSDQEMVRPSLAAIQARLAQCANLQTPRAASFSPSPRTYPLRSSRNWEEEDEYEVRDVPESGPVGRGLGPPFWGSGPVGLSAAIGAGSTES